jgi:hypothetical protein
MRVRCSPRVITNAHQVVRHIVGTYFGPNTTLRELCDMPNSAPVDPLRQFSKACRDALRLLRAGAGVLSVQEIRPPSFVNIPAPEAMTVGQQLGHVPLIQTSADPCISGTDG